MTSEEKRDTNENLVDRRRHWLYRWALVGENGRVVRIKIQCYLPTLKDNICGFGVSIARFEIMRRKHTYIVFPGSHNLIFSDSCPTCTLHISNRGIPHHFPCNICNCAVPSRLVSEIRLPLKKHNLLLNENAVPKDR